MTSSVNHVRLSRIPDWISGPVERFVLASPLSPGARRTKEVCRPDSQRSGAACTYVDGGCIPGDWCHLSSGTRGIIGKVARSAAEPRRLAGRCCCFLASLIGCEDAWRPGWEPRASSCRSCCSWRRRRRFRSGALARQARPGGAVRVWPRPVRRTFAPSVGCCPRRTSWCPCREHECDWKD
eukprot:scaffold2473_cov247-Pinguiococcus_pyrenoidosus.AAC.7